MLQVLTNAKGVLVTMLSLAVLREPLAWRNLVGYGIVLEGTLCYSIAKAHAAAQKRQAPALIHEQQHGNGPLNDSTVVSCLIPGGSASESSGLLHSDATGCSFSPHENSRASASLSEEEVTSKHHGSTESLGTILDENKMDAPLVALMDENDSEK